MVKLIQCFHRQPYLSVDEFRAAWEAYAARLRDVAAELGADRVTLSTRLETHLNQALTEARGSAPPFDGVAEIGWSTGAAVLAGAALPGMDEKIARLRETQGEFADLGRSAFFFVHEQVVLGESEG